MDLALRLRVLCISETGWFDTPTLLADVKAAGGKNVNQYDINWPPFGHLHPKNAAGSSALVEAEETDGTVHRFLFDSGWGPEWMDRRFAEEGIDKMLAQGEIAFLVISHEHFDHFWGVGSTVRHCPQLPIYIPQGFYREGLDLLKKVGHCTGEKAVERMIELGLPVVRGTARHGSKTDLYLGNGDILELDGD